MGLSQLLLQITCIIKDGVLEVNKRLWIQCELQPILWAPGHPPEFSFVLAFLYFIPIFSSQLIILLLQALEIYTEVTAVHTVYPTTAQFKSL